MDTYKVGGRCCPRYPLGGDTHTHTHVVTGGRGVGTPPFMCTCHGLHFLPTLHGVTFWPNMACIKLPALSAKAMACVSEPTALRCPPKRSPQTKYDTMGFQPVSQLVDRDPTPPDIPRTPIMSHMTSNDMPTCPHHPPTPLQAGKTEASPLMYALRKYPVKRVTHI